MQEPTKPEAVELPEQLRLLESNGTALIRLRQHEAAERIFRQIVAAAPRHVPALRYVASRALARGDLAEAQTLLERALRIAPQAPMLHQNLGIVLRAQGSFEGALLALDTALRLNPNLTMAWIQRGDVLQGLGRREEAAGSYKRAEDLCGDLRLLVRATRDAPRTRKALRRAAVFLARAREAAVAESLGPVRRANSETSLIRAERAIRTMTRAATPVYADPLQRPAFAYFPELEARPFFGREQFRFLSALEHETDSIREELLAVMAEPEELAPYVELPEGRVGPWQELNRSRKWSSYHLYRNGARAEGHCRRCPRTVAAVESLPLVLMQGQAPEVFFSILEPRTHIPPHHGLANYKLAVHLPLIIPDGCAIRVGDQTRAWNPGECLIFDDSFEHEAWNRSGQIRAVLILEVWNPGLTEAEREALQGALAAVDRFNRKSARLTQEIAQPGGGSTPR